MASLVVSLDVIAAMRAAGGGQEPDPAHAAVLAELGGADGIAVQLRTQGPVTVKDVFLLKGIVRTGLLIEVTPVAELIDRVVETKPWMAVLIGEKPGSGGAAPLDVQDGEVDLSEIAARLRGSSIWSGVLIRPDVDQVRAAAKCEFDAVLLDCSDYAMAGPDEEADVALEAIGRAAQAAIKADLEVLCGGGLNYRNLSLVAELEIGDAFLVGQGLVSRALFRGIEQATRDFVELAADRSGE